MTKRTNTVQAALGTAIAAVLTASLGAAAPAPASAQAGPGTYKPTRQVLLSVGEGQMVNLPKPVVDVWTSNAAVADVNVTSSRQIGLFGKEAGEATIIATAADGSVVYGASVRVSQNISSVNEMLRAAMPESNITVTHVGQIAVMNGTVPSPADSAQAEMLVRTLLNPGMDVSAPGAALKVMPVNRLRTATPLQVMLQVKIAEVSRSLVREIGVNLLTRDSSGGGFLFGVSRGRDIGSIEDITSPTLKDFAGNPLVVGTEFIAKNPTGGTTHINAMGRLLGVDILSALDLAETDGRVRTLAEPNLTALSGETASFLAGGEFPIATSGGLNGTQIEFKQYGVSLAFTPTVLEGGRISMRVRPEVSELSSAGAIKLNGIEVPALSTRRAETTVELGSGQSFMIGGLLRNSSNVSVDKAPFLGNLPILGALFRSNSFRRSETELVIVVTPYLVKPVSAGQIALPTDGFRGTGTLNRVLLDKQEKSRGGGPRPGPVLAEPSAGPALSSLAVPPSAPAPAARQDVQQAAVKPKSSAPAPGFSF
jgi:pilus assembly protein CpaC